MSHDWIDFYRGGCEEIPCNILEARGNTMSMHCFVDASHSSDKATRRSQTGILIFVNEAPVMFYSKQQNLVETSTFGLDFAALKQAVEMTKALRHKLWMFGVPLDGPANVHCDNEVMCKNVSVPSLVLNEKMHSVSFHHHRETVAVGVIRMAKEDMDTNLSDSFVKLMLHAR